jgi:hypothetical protein
MRPSRSIVRIHTHAPAQDVQLHVKPCPCKCPAVPLSSKIPTTRTQAALMRYSQVGLTFSSLFSIYFAPSMESNRPTSNQELRPNPFLCTRKYPCGGWITRLDLYARVLLHSLVFAPFFLTSPLKRFNYVSRRILSSLVLHALLRAVTHFPP